LDDNINTRLIMRTYASQISPDSGLAIPHTLTSLFQPN